MAFENETPDSDFFGWWFAEELREEMWDAMEDRLFDGSREREWASGGRIWEVASLENGFAVGVRGRDTMDGGSEEKESIIPATLRTS